MKIEALDRPYQDFFVPACTVEIGGKDLQREALLVVTSIEVDLKLKSPARFSVSIGNAFNWEDRDFVAGEADSRIDLLDEFAFGAKVKIALGYGEPSALTPMIEGAITEVSASYTGEGNTTLTIAGYDALYPLRLGRATRHWDKSTLANAISVVASENNLSAQVQVKGGALASIDQTQESDLAFIERMAVLSGSTFYMRAGKFYFGPRRDDRSPGLELPWGSGLIAFSPTANLAGQAAGVEVRGWSAVDARAVVGKADAGQEQGRDSSRKSGAQWLKSAFSAAPKVELGVAVRDQAEADARAAAILDSHALQFLTGEGECIGVPTLVPDTNLALSGLGRAFSKTYYVSQATHQLDENGYRTRFSVQETTL